MARVTVEDCLEKIPNKFELVLMAAKRAKDIERGVMPSVPKDKDKAAIIALREIAEETISLEGLREIAKKSILEEERNEELKAEDLKLEEEIGTEIFTVEEEDETIIDNEIKDEEKDKIEEEIEE